MNVLAVDTCLQPGSLALLRADASEGLRSEGLAKKGGEPEVVPLPPGWRSVALHEEIARLLARHNLTTASIDLYAVTAGPGAFTGVRLGLTAVKGLAEIHNKPVLPVSTLEALAGAGKNSDEWQVTSDKKGRPASESLVTRQPERQMDVVPLVTFFAPILDARRGQVFAAVYGTVCQAEKTEGTEQAERTEGTEPTERTELRLVIPEAVGSLRSFLSQVEAAGLKDVQFCLTDESLFLELQAMEGTAWRSGSLVRVSPHLAGAVARIAFARFRHGQGITALAADANYIRASDAELFWKE